MFAELNEFGCAVLVPRAAAVVDDSISLPRRDLAFAYSFLQLTLEHLLSLLFICEVNGLRLVLTLHARAKPTWHLCTSHCKVVWERLCINCIAQCPLLCAELLSYSACDRTVKLSGWADSQVMHRASFKAPSSSTSLLYTYHGVAGLVQLRPQYCANPRPSWREPDGYPLISCARGRVSSDLWPR